MNNAPTPANSLTLAPPLRELLSRCSAIFAAAWAMRHHLAGPKYLAETRSQLVIRSVGGVVTQAQPLMVIVPGVAQVTAEVTIDNKDIGFVSAGQEVTVKLETFPYTRYGTIPAKVSRVSADAVVDDKRQTSGASNNATFPATLTLSQSSINIDGKQVRLTPGMNLTAEIKTGQRRVIEYLLSPIQQAGGESLRER